MNFPISYHLFILLYIIPMIDLIICIIDFFVGIFSFDDSSVYCAGIPVDIGAALIGGASSLLGSALGFGSNTSANRTNVRLARETNALNYKMFLEQNQYNRDMWNANNEYNSPSNQVKRALLAGLNPYFDAGNLVSASNSTAPSSVPLPSLSTPSVRPYDPQSAFSQVGDIASNVMLKRAQINNLNQQTQSSKQLTYAQVKEYLARSEDLKHSAQFRAITNNLLRDTYDYEKQSKMYNSYILREQWLQNMAQTKIANVQAEMAKMHLATYPKELQLGITQQIANVMLTKAQTHRTYKEAALAAAQTIESQVRAEGYRISNEQAYQLVPYVVDKAAYDSYQARQEYQVYRKFGTKDVGRKTHRTTEGSLGISKYFGGMFQWNENYDDWMELPEDWFTK